MKVAGQTVAGQTLTDQSANDFEYRFESRFPDELLRLMEADGVGYIRTKVLGYGTMVAEVSLFGMAKSVFEFFNENPEILNALVAIYVPVAFASTFPEFNLAGRVHARATARHPLGPTTTHAPGPLSALVSLANLSLVLPALLLALAAYLMLESSQRRDEAVRARQGELLAFYKQLLDTERSRILTLEERLQATLRSQGTQPTAAVTPTPTSTQQSTSTTPSRTQ